MIESLIAHLFFLRELAHRAHLRTSSYAQHVALGEFYGAIGDRADAIAEAYMGRDGEMIGTIPFVIEQPTGDIVADITAQRDWIDANRTGEECLDRSEIQNLIDEAVSTIDSVLYKLTFLS
ncbi:MAG: hypothetical protein CGW95_01440 [Phenylobacterium zucineum]|nr:MAG: hypothetical protein CGW95_01440 [Phenylobacterium zucineum]